MAMTYVSGVAPIEVGDDQTALTRLWESVESYGDEEILRHYDDGAWRSVTWRQLYDRVREVAAGLVALGVQPGDRVGLMSESRLEWTIADLAVLAAGGVTVPIYETSSAQQAGWILSDSEAKAAFASTADIAKRADQAREQATDLGEVLVFDDAGLDALAERGGQDEHDEVDRRVAALTGDDLASIIYTSGTTGNPKGCVLTHRNIAWTARQTQISLSEFLKPGDSTLLFLPLAHVFARLIQYGCLENRVVLGFARSRETIVEDLESFSPTFLLAVPRVFEKVYNGAQRKATGLKRPIFRFAAKAAEDWASTDKPSAGAKLRKGVANKLVFSKMREAVGGRVRYSVSGGAPLAPYLAHFFQAAGMPILEGYGLTETTAPATVNTPKAMRIGTVGQPLPGVEIKIADDGEVLIRGGNIFQGYYKNEQATKEVLTDDGWFHSGDVGELDDGGFLRITGRKKELIVTAGGKNVAPAVLEERMKSYPLVSQVMAVGDNRPFVAALVTLDEEELPVWAEERGLEGSTAAELKDHPDVIAEVEQAVEHANAAVSKAESIRKFRILDRDFTEEDNEVTPTMKLRRKQVSEHFADEIEALYDDKG